MNKNVILIIRAGLLALAAFLAYQTYRVVMEPIEYERLEAKRFAQVIDRLEDIRDAQKLYKTENGQYTPSINVLIGFIDTGMVQLRERKDSSFMRYNKVFQKDMMVDTVVFKTIGEKSVKAELFNDESYDAERLRYIPFTDNVEFNMDATILKKTGGLEVPVFKAWAGHNQIFADIIEKGQYEYFIDKSAEVSVGSLTEASVSGNWK